MRFVRAALVLVLAGSLARSAAPASAQPVSRPPAAPQVAGSITVTIPFDQWSPFDGTNTQCSLREAIQTIYANHNQGCTPPNPAATEITINFTSAGTYKLTLPEELPHLGSGRTIIIDKPGVVIDGNKDAGRYTGIFQVAGATLRLKNITLQNGNREVGGAIWLRGGAVYADKVKFLHNGSYDGSVAQSLLDPQAPSISPTNQGGAIQNDGFTLEVKDSLFQNNEAGIYGGAVATSAGLFLRTKFLSNEAQGGGAVYITTPTTQPVEFIETEFKQNIARRLAGFPGGWEVSDDLYGGGAILNSGHLRLALSLLEDNRAEQTRGGGGLVNDPAGTAVLEDCVFTANKAALNFALERAWGGAILNGGDMDIVRCSIYGNQAYWAGGVFNGYAGDLGMYNSHITNNTATSFGGLVNDHFSFNPDGVADGATVELYHTTIGANTPSSPGANDAQVYSLASHSIYFANSIIAAGCNGTQYVYGNSLAGGPCVTIPEPSHGLVTQTLAANVSAADLGLAGLAAGNPKVPKHQVQKIDGTSWAVDIGRDDDYGCDYPLIDHHDMLQNTRPPGGCDAGDFEAGSATPFYTSNPGVGLITFPVVAFSQGVQTSTVTLGFSNTGGGALTWEMQDLGGSPNNWMVTLQDGPAAGVLLKNQTQSLTFVCAPYTVGDVWKLITIATNAQNRRTAAYKLRCTGAGVDPLASTSEMPAPLNMPPVAAATGLQAVAASQATIAVTNNGEQTLNVSYTWTNADPMWTAGHTGPAAGEAAEAPAGGPVAVPPGQSLNLILGCTPPEAGVFVNTLLINSNDPSKPVHIYPVSCEGLHLTPPETVNPGGVYTTTSEFEAVAVSPDGALVVGGQYDNNNLRVYNRSSSTGALSYVGAVGWPGMTQIYGAAFSRDGKNVYFNSRAGNGVVTTSRSGSTLQATQAITAGTLYLCGINPFSFCPMNTMFGARGIAVSPDDQFVYVVGYSSAPSSTLTVLSRQAGSGSLGVSQIITRVIDGVNVLGGASRVAVSPDGQHIYVTAEIDDVLAVFQRAPDGDLNLVAAYRDGEGGLTTLDWPADVAVSPDGAYVYATAWSDHALNIFQRGSADGMLTHVGAVTDLVDAWGVAITNDPSGERVFLTQYSGNRLDLFSRDAATGALSRIGAYTNTVNGNIFGPVYAAVSPNNMDVYVSLYEGQGLRHFQTIRHLPVVTHISPAAVPAGSDTFSLTVKGGGFYPNSVVRWAGNSLTTNFISEYELAATVPAGLVASAGTAAVNVRTPSPGGGDSNVETFTISEVFDAPIPSIASLEPPEAAFGGEDLLVLVHGSNFTPDAQVSYNGQWVPVTYINHETLQITLSAAVLTEPGTGGIAILNGTVEGGGAAQGWHNPGAVQGFGAQSSAVAGFYVAQPGEAPVPSVNSLWPASIISGSAEMWLTVLGANFSTDPLAPSIGQWNGQARETVVLDEGELLMLLLAGDLDNAGVQQVTVATPGAGASVPMSFKVLAPGENPVPVLLSAAPNLLTGATINLVGADFAPGATVTVNGLPRTVTYVDATLLTVPLLPYDTGGAVIVTNPGPGGGVSVTRYFLFGRVWLPVVIR